MPTHQQRAGQRADGSQAELSRQQIESLEAMYGNRYLLEPAPDNELPKSGMSAEEAMGLIQRLSPRTLELKTEELKAFVNLADR